MWEPLFDFLLKVIREYGFSAFVLVVFTFVWPYYTYKMAKKMIDEKEKEIKRMAEEKARWEKRILGDDRKSSKPINEQ